MNHAAATFVNTKTQATGAESTTTHVCNGRGRSYCLVHRRYFETSWCPDCSRTTCKSSSQEANVCTMMINLWVFISCSLSKLHATFNLLSLSRSLKKQATHYRLSSRLPQHIPPHQDIFYQKKSHKRKKQVPVICYAQKIVYATNLPPP